MFRPTYPHAVQRLIYRSATPKPGHAWSPEDHIRVPTPSSASDLTNPVVASLPCIRDKMVTLLEYLRKYTVIDLDSNDVARTSFILVQVITYSYLFLSCGKVQAYARYDLEPVYCKGRPC